jgi:hypothetical protein
MRHAIRPFLLTTVLGILLAGSTGVARADDGALKASHDTDPHVPLTTQQVQMTAAKRSVECGESCDGGGGYPSSAHLAANQTPQSKNYFCGPAVIHEALDALGVSLTQSAAAAALRTTSVGTAWSGVGTKPSGFPVPDVLNANQRRNYYVPQPVAAPPTSNAISTYAKDLVTDIAGVHAPLVGDAWETSTSGHHLVGHPTDRTIFHWFEIRGYDNSGATTLYEDSVHGATSVSWYAGVPAYSALPSSWIMSIVGGRGYVW